MLMKMPEFKKAKFIPMRLEMFPSKLKGNQQKNWVEKIMKAFVPVDDLIPEVSVPD